jgi:hypothetical protein
MSFPHRELPDPKTPTWFKVWFAVCAVVSVGFLGLIVWAIIAVVSKVTR